MVFDKVWKLRRIRKRAADSFEQELQSANNYEERNFILSNECEELRMIDDEIRGELTKRLLRRARNFDISIPDDNNSWETNQESGTSYLRDHIRYELAQRVRKESKELREYYFGIWKDVVLVLSGLAGIVSLILSHRTK